MHINFNYSLKFLELSTDKRKYAELHVLKPYLLFLCKYFDQRQYYAQYVNPSIHQFVYLSIDKESKIVFGAHNYICRGILGNINDNFLVLQSRMQFCFLKLSIVSIFFFFLVQPKFTINGQKFKFKFSLIEF